MTAVIEMETSQNSTIPAVVLVGLFFFLAGSVILMGIITAEIFYSPRYSTANSEISDLGATRPPDSIIYQPSASIVDTTMIVGGLLILAASFFFFRHLNTRIAVLFSALLGISVLGVGIFPGNMAPVHAIFALVAFISGALAAIVSYRVTSSPFRYVLVLLGLITFIFLFFFSFFIPILGDGGTERFVAYSVIIWAIGFGGYIIGTGRFPAEMTRSVA